MLNQFLEWLDKLKDMDIVRFFSQFFTEEKLGPLFRWFQNSMTGQTYGDRAKQLLVYAAIFALITLAIDQVVYWTDPAQIGRARRNYEYVMGGLRSLGDSARTVAGRIRGALSRRAGHGV